MERTVGRTKGETEGGTDGRKDRRLGVGWRKPQTRFACSFLQASREAANGISKNHVAATTMRSGGRDDVEYQTVIAITSNGLNTACN